MRGAEYRDLSENNRLRTVPIHANRGVVRDRAGAVLTRNDPAFNLRLYRDDVTDAAADLAGVGLGLLEHVQRNRRLAVDAGPVFLVRLFVRDARHVLQTDR